jgi:hypothetical protein
MKVQTISSIAVTDTTLYTLTLLNIKSASSFVYPPCHLIIDDI